MRAIVFVLRGCSVGWLGCYGNEWVGTPNLDRLAAESVTFDTHVSDCPEPNAARQAWLSGRHQIPAICPPAQPRTPLETPHTLLRQLQESNVLTVLVRANHPDTDALPPYYAAWREVFDARPQADDHSPLSALIRLLPSLLDRLSEVPRWLICVEVDRLIPPWDVPQEVFEAYVGDEASDDEEADNADGEEVSHDEAESDTEVAAHEPVTSEPVIPWYDPPTGLFDTSDLVTWDWLQATFAAVVTSLDAELGRVFDELRSRGLDQTATWVVTSDHGYPLGEHGLVGPHRPWLHEEFVHLPLIVRLPGAVEAGRRVTAITQPCDLMATLLDLFATELPQEPSHGFSLLPLVHGVAASVREYGCSGLELAGAIEYAIRTRSSLLLLPSTTPSGDTPRCAMLFEKPDDRWEVHDTLTQHPYIAEHHERVLRAFVAACQHPGALVVPELSSPHSADS